MASVVCDRSMSGRPPEMLCVICRVRADEHVGYMGKYARDEERIAFSLGFADRPSIPPPPLEPTSNGESAELRDLKTALREERFEHMRTRAKLIAAERRSLDNASVPDILLALLERALRRG